MATRRHMFLALLCAGIPGNPEGTGRAECQPRAGGGPLADTLISFIDFGPIGPFRRICACAGAYGAGACSQAHMRHPGTRRMRLLYAPNRRMRLRAVLEDPRSSASRCCSMGERRLLPPAAHGEWWEDGFLTGLLNSLCVLHLLSHCSTSPLAQLPADPDAREARPRSHADGRRRRPASSGWWEARSVPGAAGLLTR